jgi:hypothetical protein
MRRVIRLTPREVRPEDADVLRHQGIPPGAAVSPGLRALLRGARAAFDELVAPAAVFDEVSRDEFEAIYSSAAAGGTPMLDILPLAEALALFAATIGGGMESEIRRRLSAGDAPLACTLDAFASAATERLADLVAREYEDAIGCAERGSSPTRVVPYSPGYCGWDVRGQRSIFDRLQPDDIGIDLNERCCMEPTKSVSGVLVAGSSAAHRVRPVYEFCDTCVTRTCRDRLRALRESS